MDSASPSTTDGGSSTSAAAEHTPPETTPSDGAVTATMQRGFETMAVRAAAGLVLGGLAGIVLARSGAAGARKGMAGLGAGIGLGSGWTRTSMNLEEMLALDGTPKK